MGRTKKKFDKEFKLEAVKMVLDEGLSRAEVSRRLGIHQAVIGNWVKAFQEDGVVGFPGQGKLKPQDEKVRQLERENRLLREEIEFLKKTASYFASQKK